MLLLYSRIGIYVYIQYESIYEYEPESNKESVTYPEDVGAHRVSRAQRAQCRAETERPSSGPWGTPLWRNTPEGGPNQPPGNRFQDASLDSVATL